MKRNSANSVTRLESIGKHDLNQWVHSFDFFQKLEYSKIWKRRLPIFQKFQKALFQFRILLTKVRKTIFRCLIFLGKVHTMDIEHFAIFWTLRSFPKNITHPKNILRMQY